MPSSRDGAGLGVCASRAVLHIEDTGVGLLIVLYQVMEAMRSETRRLVRHAGGSMRFVFTVESLLYSLLSSCR